MTESQHSKLWFPFQITPLAYRVSLQTCLRLDVQHEVNSLFCFLDLKQKVQTNTAIACIRKTTEWQQHLQYPISLRADISLIYEVLCSNSLRSCPIPKHLRLLRPRVGKSLWSASFTTRTAGKRNQASYFWKRNLFCCCYIYITYQIILSRGCLHLCVGAVPLCGHSLIDRGNKIHNWAMTFMWSTGTST